MAGPTQQSLIAVLLLFLLSVPAALSAAGATTPSPKHLKSAAVNSTPPLPTPWAFPSELDSSKPSPQSSAVFPIFGDVYPHGLYFVSMSIGDPPSPYFLDVDTDSDLTWLQCDASCVSCSKVRSCFKICDPQMTMQSRFPQCESPDRCDYRFDTLINCLCLGVVILSLDWEEERPSALLWYLEHGF